MRHKNLVVGSMFLVISIAMGSLAYSQGVNPDAGFGMEESIINVANITGKAVVSISSEFTTKIGGNKKFYFKNSPLGNSPFGDEDSLNKFFEDFFGEIPQREFKQSGLGSGVIIDSEGYILTNEHVVRNADKITVTLPDGREFKGEVKGSDPRSDLAVIKINAHNLPVAALGNSENIKIGQWVVAIGNPFGFAMQNPEPTVTVGVISALHRSLGRSLSREKDYNDLIQTDAAINPGNSGGPLVNLKGEVVGINVAIFSTSGGYEGVGFAIPISKAKRIISRLSEGKKVLYGWLGVTVQDLTEDLAGYFGTADKTGVLVAKVLEKSPAQESGMKEGDIIRKFNNKDIKDVRELLDIVGSAEVGKKVKVTVLRNKKELILNAEIGERPQEVEKEKIDTAPVSAEVVVWRGLEVEDANSDNIQKFDLEEKSGVVITDVKPNSPTDSAGLMEGDVILEINKKPVKSVSDYRKVTKDLKGTVLVRTARGFFLIKESAQ